MDTADGGMTGGDRGQHVHEFQAIHRGDPPHGLQAKIGTLPAENIRMGTERPSQPSRAGTAPRNHAEKGRNDGEIFLLLGTSCSGNLINERCVCRQVVGKTRSRPKQVSTSTGAEPSADRWPMSSP